MRNFKLFLNKQLFTTSGTNRVDLQKVLGIDSSIDNKTFVGLGTNTNTHIYGNVSTGATVTTTAGAAFQVNSTTGGLVVPIMTGAQATAYNTAGAPAGAIIHVTSSNGDFLSAGFWGKTGTTWAKF